MIKSRRIHISWLIAWLSTGFLAGIATSPIIGFRISGINLFFLGFSLVIAGLMSKNKKAIILVFMGGALLGVFRGDSALLSRAGYDKFFDQTVNVTGVVSDNTTINPSGLQKIKLKNVVLNDHEIEGAIWVSTSDQTDIKRSDNLTVSGRLSRGFGNFPASIHQAEIIQVVRIKNKDPARELRDWFASGVRKVIDEPQASLGIGFLTGQNSTLPEELSNNLRILGLTHIVVASGYNLTILVRLSRRAFSKISKYWATVSSLFLISGFVMVTGFSPSMTRAGIITSLSILAWHYGRRIHPIVLLSFTAALTALINPSYVWGDLGWYLSFAAFTGVIILAPLIYHYFWGDKKTPGTLHQIFLETVSAQIMTAPIIALAFSQYAPLALPANLSILIFIPFAMLATFVAGIVGLTGSFELLAIPGSVVLNYITLVVDKLSLLPLAIMDLNFDIRTLLACYLLIFSFMIFLWRRTKHDFLKSSVVE